MPASPITAMTDRRVFNGIVNMRIKPYVALRSLLFPESRTQTLAEETAQLDVLTGSYGMAPFVKQGQRAILMDSLNGTSYTVACPFINIKRTLKYGNRLAARLAGGSVFVNNDTGALMQAIQQALAEDADMLNTLIDNREEWMVAMLLQNALAYSQDGYDSFTVDSGKPGGNDFAATVLWDIGDGTARPLSDIRTVKRLVASYRGPMPNVAICGADAASALFEMIEADLIKPIKTDSGVLAGTADLTRGVEDDGMMYIGRLGGVDFYEYSGSYPDDTTGADTPLIRDDYVEFFSTSSRSESMRDLYYGLIPDLLAIMNGQAVTKRYGAVDPPKVDQGTMQGILKSRPLPWFRRADWQVSLQVV